MAIKHLFTRGYGFGGTRYIPTRGYLGAGGVVVTPSDEPGITLSAPSDYSQLSMSHRANRLSMPKRIKQLSMGGQR